MESFFPLLAGWLLNVEPAVCSGTQAWGTLGLTFPDLSNLGLRCERNGLYQWLRIAWRRNRGRDDDLFYSGKLSVCGLRKITQLLSGVSGRYSGSASSREWSGPGRSSGASLALATGVIRIGGRVVSNVLFVGLVGCLAGQDGPLTWMLSQCGHSFLRLCPPPAPWGDTLTGFPLSSCVLMGAGPQP